MHDILGIITSGGGMTCGYIAGQMLALAIEQNYKQPPILIGASGSVGADAYYVTGQYDKIEETWTEHLASKDFVNWER